jgi:homoserine dehydrogenase
MNMTKVLKIAVAGVGTVGSGVIENIAKKQDLFLARTGTLIQVTDISSRTKTGRDVDITPYQWHDNPLDLVKTDADIIIETIGGESGTALELITLALNAGKHIVTANKALLAVHGHKLAQLAEKNNVSLNYESAVAGGIPVIKALKEGLSANEYSRIYGILNGTCNYILTQMEETGGDFHDILKNAQKLGYAEADPTLDIGGFDTAHKLTILSALAFGVQIDYSATSVEGIEHITDLDIKYAKKLGYRIKLLGTALRQNGKIMQSVHPVMLSPNIPAANVGGAYNAVVIQSDYADDTVLIGRGAGRNPTASAVVADIIDIARHVVMPVFGIKADLLKRADFAPLSQRTGRYYLRLNLMDKSGAIADITAILAKHNISVQSFIQEDEKQTDNRHVIIITHDTTEQTMSDAMTGIEHSKYSVTKPVMIRIM